MLLILTSNDDVHADGVARSLQAQGVAFARFDPASFPSKATLQCDPHRGGHASLTTESGRIALDEVSCVWVRRPGKPAADPSVTDEFMRGYVAMEAAHVLEDVWESLDCPFLPARPSVMRRADLKLTQMKAAERVGLTVPPTLVTSDPGAFREFRRLHDGKIISKLAGPSLFRQPTHIANRLTERVTRSDLGYAESVRHCPLTFQAYVDKSFEVRATVVGDRVLAAAIHSQSSQRTRIDWRRYDLGHTPHEAHELPASVKEKCVALVASLGLAYGALDFVVTSAGEYVFLEINPNGQFLWIEDHTGLPITETIAAWLARRSGGAAR